MAKRISQTFEDAVRDAFKEDIPDWGGDGDDMATEPEDSEEDRATPTCNEDHVLMIVNGSDDATSASFVELRGINWRSNLVVGLAGRSSDSLQHIPGTLAAGGCLFDSIAR